MQNKKQNEIVTDTQVEDEAWHARTAEDVLRHLEVQEMV